MIDTDPHVSRCCKAEVGFYDWYICAECGATIHNPAEDADLDVAQPVGTAKPESEKEGEL